MEEEVWKKEIENDELNKFRKGNMSLVLDSYDALFSDFDPRPYSERSLSDDFVSECKSAAKDKDGAIELRLLIPTHLRKQHEEIKIKKRLKDYFKTHIKEVEKETKQIKKGGFIWFFIGSILLVTSTFLYEYKIDIRGVLNFLFDFLFIISQPAGWFLCWEGLDRIFVKPLQKVPDHDFYKKMSNAEIYFLNF
jgi:predicted small metal-binding protein